MKKLSIFIAVSLLTLNLVSYAVAISRVDFVKNTNVLFLKGDYASLVANTKTNLNRSRLGRNDKKEVLYLTGLAYINLGEFIKARGALNNVLKIGGSKFKEES